MSLSLSLSPWKKSRPSRSGWCHRQQRMAEESDERSARCCAAGCCMWLRWCKEGRSYGSRLELMNINEMQMRAPLPRATYKVLSQTTLIYLGPVAAEATGGPGGRGGWKKTRQKRSLGCGCAGDVTPTTHLQASQWETADTSRLRSFEGAGEVGAGPGEVNVGQAPCDAFVVNLNTADTRTRARIHTRRNARCSWKFPGTQSCLSKWTCLHSVSTTD